MIKFRSIWGERQANLDELDPSIHRWLSLCHDLVPPPATMIREFYSNLSTYYDDSGGHYLTTWIRGEEFWITKEIVFEALHVPRL